MSDSAPDVEAHGSLDLLSDAGIAVWAELFYDLIYVAAMLIFSAAAMAYLFR